MPEYLYLYYVTHVLVSLQRKLNRRIEQRYNESDEENQDGEYFLRQAQSRAHKAGKVIILESLCSKHINEKKKRFIIWSSIRLIYKLFSLVSL